MIEEQEKIHMAEAYLDSFIVDVEHSVYNCPYCGDKHDLEKIVDLTEAKKALELLQNWKPD